jgi:hypothetical protein
VNGAGQTGTSITVNATAGDSVAKGDKISIINVNQVNPMTRRIPGAKKAKMFTVTQALTFVGGGTDVIQVLPAIFPPGSQYQNVDATPANAAAVTLWPGTPAPNGVTGTVGMMLSRYAFALVGAKLYSPKAVEVISQRQDEQTGIAVRFVRAWDPVRSMNINRWDMAIGFGNLYQDNAAVAIALA